VLLIVSDGSASQSATLSVTIANQAPLAQISGPTSGNVGQPLSFDGSASSDPDGNPLSYSWQVDGVQVGTAPLLSWTFTHSGPHTVVLSVSDGEASQNSVLNVQIEALPPIASAGSDQTVKQRSLVTLDASASYDPQGGALSYQWQQIAGSAVLLNSSTSASPSFEAPGIKGGESVTLVFEVTVREPDGAIATDTVSITLVKKL